MSIIKVGIWFVLTPLSSAVLLSFIAANRSSIILPLYLSSLLSKYGYCIFHDVLELLESLISLFVIFIISLRKSFTTAFLIVASCISSNTLN